MQINCVSILTAGLTLLALPVRAGTITVKGAEPGSLATVSFEDGSGATESRTQVVAADGTAVFKWSKSAQENATKIIKKYVKAGQAPATNTESGYFTLGALPGMEPLALPSLKQVPAAATFFDIFFDIDLENFHNNAGPLAPGQDIDILNGLGAELPGYLIHEGDDAGDPLFSGTLRIADFHTYEPVPEPGSLLLLSLGLICFALRRSSIAKARFWRTA